MTNNRQKASKRSSQKSDHQVRLPLGARENSPSKALAPSKLVFQLKSELHRLQQRDKEWKMMFNMLAHDLKEPLLTLEGFTKILEQSSPLTKDQKRYVKISREAVGSLHLLIGSLQSIAKLYQDPSELSDLSLLQILESVTLALSEQIKRNRGKVILPKEDVILRGDAVRLYQVFLNLIANSLKYHRKDADPVIIIKHRKDSQWHRISINDNGIGIDKRNLEKIFAPFTRIEESPTDGLGIGLTIVKRIAESFGGRIGVRSQMGKGTTFTVFLPREKR